MPSIQWNLDQWNIAYNWDQQGEEWSLGWGSSLTHWHTSLFPRLHPFLPAGNILEIAPGRGRWTRFLLPLSQSYVGIDLSENNIAFCRDKFQGHADCCFYANDGLSLEAASKHAPFDFVFSFDSLVHAGPEVLSSYIAQILKAGLLSQDGVAFIHHSNLNFLNSLDQTNLVRAHHSRDPDSSFIMVRNLIHEHGGKVLIQELYAWEQPLLDCFTLFCLKDGKYASMADVLLTNNLPERELGRGIFNHYSSLMTR